MADTRLDSVSEVVKALGGTKECARLTGKSTQQISNYRRWGKFPSTSYLVMSAVLAKRGIQAPPELWGMEGYSVPSFSDPPFGIGSPDGERGA